MPPPCGTGTTLHRSTCRRPPNASARPSKPTRAGMACGPFRSAQVASRARSTITRTTKRNGDSRSLDRGACVLAARAHDGGGAAGDRALLPAPERASDRGPDRAGEPGVAAARGDAALHRGGPAARLALRRGRVPQRRDVQPAAHGMDAASVTLEYVLAAARMEPGA